jgi:phosphopantothenoylcysteine decarboxylase/phosphopantothenate--cysteine ligase
MGYAIGEAAIEAGHEVILISGPVNLGPPRRAKLVSVSTSDEMFDAVLRHADNCDVCILCAAVADYKPAKVSPVKIKKRAGNLSLELIPTRDILDSLGRRQNRQFLLIGFAAETNDVEQNALQKLRAKNCDIMVANDARLGMESDENELMILFRQGEMKTISRAPKKILAHELVKIFSEFARKTFDKKNVTITERT